MELKEGMYVRTDNGIGKYIGFNEMEFWDGKGKANYREFLKEPSYNIIDLIEVGDYVNGFRVDEVDYSKSTIYIGNTKKVIEQALWSNDIKSIVTKEMFSNVEYRVETD